MTPQPWLAVTLAIVVLATAGYCVTRLALSWRRARPTDRFVDAAHVLMGVAMAGMLVPGLQVLPAASWEVLLGAGAVAFGVRFVRARRAAPPGGQRGRAHNGQHVLGCGAMVYMLAAMGPAAPARGATAARSAATASMSGGLPRVPAVALVLAVALFACVVWSADRIAALAPVAVLADRVALLSPRPGGVPLAGVPLSPRLAACCEIAMGVTMGYMLIVLM